jgi:hypothetical protein
VTPARRRTPGRGALALCFRRCLRAAALPTALAAACGLVGWRVSAPELGGENAPAAASPWLALPLLVAAAACALAAATFWPTFALGRPGRSLVDRVQRGPLRGAGAAVAGALLAQLVLTLPVATVVGQLLGAPATVTATVPLAAPARPVLDAQRPELTFAVADPAPMRELWLRPLAGLPGGALHGTTVDVLADGERLQGPPVAFLDTRQLLRVAFAPRAIRELRLVHTGGTVPLWFPDGAATLVRAEGHGALANGLWLALATLLPAFVALALGCACGRVAALPTVLTVVAGALFVQTVGGLGPFDGALLARMRGAWLPAGPLFRDGAASLAVGALAMILAMLSRREVAR